MKEEQKALEALELLTTIVERLTNSIADQRDKIGKLTELVNKLSGEVARLEVLIRDEDDEI
jgi:peptidoglycan hydrolase CwlO-like protein